MVYKYTLEKTEGAIKNGESRDTGNIGKATHQVKKKKQQQKTNYNTKN
jgi:hypothetical protein